MGAGRRVLKPPETDGSTELYASENAAPNERETQNFAGETRLTRSTRSDTSPHRSQVQKLLDKNKNT